MKTVSIKFLAILTLFVPKLLSAQAYNYTWMKGSPSASLAVYGTMGVANPNNTPGSQSNGTTWTDASGNLWLYGGKGFATTGTYDYLSDLWKYSPGTNNWTWINGSGTTSQVAVYGTLGVPSYSNNPGGRASSASWIDATGNLWLFGGLVNGNPCNDLWRYSITNNQWTWMGGSNTPSQTAVYGSMTVPSSTNIPGASYNFVSWKDAAGNFWLYDAIDGTEIWKYDPVTAQWAWMSGNNTGIVMPVFGTMGVSSSSVHPGERYTEGVSDASGNLYMFGGDVYTATGFGRGNDLWKYTISTNQWTWIGGTQSTSSVGSYGTQGVFSSTTVPSGRYGHVMWMDSNNKLWVFGGEYGSLVGMYWLNDTWCYDIATGQWAWMKGSSTPFSFSTAWPTGVYGTQLIPAAPNTPGWRTSATYWQGDPYALWIFSGMEWISSNELWRLSGCNSTNTISVSSSNSTLCPGATATLTASGSAGSYLWNTGAQTSTIAVSPSSTTVYYVVGSGTANCSIAGVFTLAVQPMSLSVLSSSVALCSGQSVTLTASGATTYTWNGGQTGPFLVVAPLTTTTYSVTGAAGSCSASANFIQFVNPTPLLTISSSSSLICRGDSALLNVSGALTYSWSGGQTSNSLSISPVSTTVYTVTGTAGGCSSTASFTQVVVPLPVLFVNGPSNTICSGQTVLLSAQGANSYTWNVPGINTPVIQVTPASTTNYSVTGTGNNGCVGAAMVTVSVSACTDLRKYGNEDNRLAVYPNPASTVFTISATAGETVKIINSQGLLILEQKLESGSLVIRDHLMPGVYYCITSGEKSVKFLILD